MIFRSPLFFFDDNPLSDNKAEVARLNALNDGATYALNKHAHLTKDEFSLYYLGMKPTNKAPVENLVGSRMFWSVMRGLGRLLIEKGLVQSLHRYFTGLFRDINMYTWYNI